MAQRLDDEIVANGAPLEPEDTEETDDVVANGAPLTEETEEPEADRFDDLYSTKAPKWSIASGADFGRLSGLRNLGGTVDVSTIERLLLC